MSQNEDKRLLLQAAAAHHRAGRLDVAESVYRAVLALDPAAAEAQEALGRLHEARGREGRQRSSGQAETCRAAAPAATTGGHAPVLAALQAGRLEEAEGYARALSGDDAFGLKVLGALLARRGEVHEARTVLERARRLTPDDPELLNNLGHVCQRLGLIEDAVAHYRLALGIAPDRAEVWNNLAMSLREQGALDAALECCDRAVALTLDYARAHDNRGLLLRELGRPEAALRAHERALELQPGFVEALSNQGLALKALGRVDAALVSQREAVRLRPDDADLLLNLGATLNDLGHQREALRCFDRALERVPGKVEAHGNRGLVLHALGMPEAAEISYRRALALNPCSIEALNNLGILLHELGRRGEALQCLDQALTLDEEDVNAHTNRANVLKDQGRLEEALDAFEHACMLDPGLTQARSNLLFTLNYHPDRTAQEIFTAYRDYDRRYGEPASAYWRPSDNTRVAERRLRLGYLSPDFRSHAIRYMLEPLLECHDHAQFELYAYAELAREDAQTARYRSLVDHWVPTRGLSDAQLAERIRADGIDILVDLAGHTAGNRLGAFARKPAPVSVSLWVGYGYTSGLSAIDYFLCDEVLVPEGAEELFSERPWRIAAPAGMYRPSEGMGAVNVLPALERGYITFGTLTRGVRVNHRTIR
ncbi:tetratricopeptide repeat protein, partial [Marichromatium sp. AB32]|uniref:tetratricopeptide repeat protein n=1 Tax=Marichromatium sp. AB32 TaxID=2483363 RepID=UPI000F3C313B